MKKSFLLFSLLIIIVMSNSCYTVLMKTNNPIESSPQYDDRSYYPDEILYPFRIDLDFDDIHDIEIEKETPKQERIPSLPSAHMWKPLPLKCLLRPLDQTELHEYPLPRGVPVSPNLSWSKAPIILCTHNDESKYEEIWEGDWIGVNGIFLGFRILKNWHYYYGWISLSCSPSTGEVTIHDWETCSEPETIIAAGEREFEEAEELEDLPESDDVPPLDIYTAAEQYMLERLGEEFFDNHVSFERCSFENEQYSVVFSTNILDSHIEFVLFVSPDAQYVEESETKGVPDCVSFPEQCSFCIDRAMAISIGCGFNGLGGSCRASLHFDSQRRFFVWSVSTSVASDNNPNFIRTTTVVIDAGTGAILGTTEHEDYKFHYY